jgi:hypothetical protein
MKNLRSTVWGTVLLIISATAVWSQQNANSAVDQPAGSTSQLPRLVRFSGTLKDVDGRPLTGITGVTFSLYSEQAGGAALWLETQNITADSNGHYVALLGSSTPDGLPAEIFTSEQARWVGVQVSGQAEQPRVLLVAVPYALKSGDAETIGGLPASAFVLANGAQGAAVGTKSAPAPASNAASKNAVPPANPDVTGKGVVDYIPMWDTTSDIVDSIIFQKSSEIGINTTTPAATLDVNGKTGIRDTLTLFPKSTDSTLAINGTAFKIDQTGKVKFVTGQTFPGAGTITGVTTAPGSGLSGGGTTGMLSLKVPSAGITNAMLANSTITLNANAAGGITTPGAMTLGSTYTMGLKTCSANQVLEYVGSAWTCASVGTGTITGVTAGTDLTGGGATGTVTLNVDTTKVPQLASANTFTANQTISGNLTATGAVFGQTAIFSGNNSSQVEGLSQAGNGIYGNTAGVSGLANGFAAVLGDSQSYFGVWGTSGSNDGVHGNSVSGNGVAGFSQSGYAGVYGNGGTGVAGASSSASGPGGNFTGFTAPSGSGLSGTDGADAHGGNAAPTSSENGGNGVMALGGTGDSFEFVGNDGSGGVFTGGSGNFSGDGVDAFPGSGYAGYFDGNLDVRGTIFAGTKDFRIDHPLDPANKYLVHASVESSEMMNIYDGNITTDGQGNATVQLPEWFEVLNTDFRYQLTVIGQFAQAIVARKIENNQFEIRTSAPNVEVSWQVTGVRQDAYAKAKPLVVEQEKDARLRGFYIHPELYGAPPEKQIEWARHPQTMKKMQEMRARQSAAAQQPIAPRK